MSCISERNRTVGLCKQFYRSVLHLANIAYIYVLHFSIYRFKYEHKLTSPEENQNLEDP